MRPILYLLIIVTALLCSAPGGAASFRDGQMVMGTILEVTVEADDQDTARRLTEAVVAAVRHWDDVLTTWRGDGELARLNASAGKGSVAVGGDLYRALQQMQQLSAVTGGAFDPAVGPLVDLWRGKTVPSEEALRHAPIAMPEVLRLDRGNASLQAGARLDSGGIGKGIALDAVLALLKSGGANAAFVNFGGSSQLAYTKADAEVVPWQIVVAGLGPGSVLGRLKLSNGCVSTSRSSAAGDSAGPIINPHTRRPVPAARQVTVIAPDSTQADAWSTALVVLGRDGLSAAHHAHIEAIIDEAGSVSRTANFPLRVGRVK